MKLNLFNKKEESHVPVAEVEGMLRTGTPEAVIRSRLKEEKHSPEDINKAIDQAKIKIGATGVPSDLKPPWEQLDTGGATPGQPPAPSFPPPAQPGPPSQGGPAKGPAEIPPPPPQLQPIGQDTPPWESNAPKVGKYSMEDLESVVHPLIEGLKLEMDSKIDSLSNDLKKISSTEKKLEKLVSELEGIKRTLSAISTQKSGVADYDEELAQLKGSVNSILEILKGTLPPVIKTLRELKGDNTEIKKKKKEVAHLI